MSTLRADLHVHSRYSRHNGNLPFLKSRDCYSGPEAVYHRARARGMDLVTITDHDTIDGCLAFLDRHPAARDFFISEEVSCRFPDGDIEVHVGVYGMTERLHAELQPLRRNVFDVTARLREAGACFSLNHLLHFYRGQTALSAYLRLLGEFPAIETRNGTMLASHNQLVARIAGTWYAPHTGRPLAAVGGSDAHTLRRVGRTWTAAPGRNCAEFLESLMSGHSVVGGEHGGTAAVALDAYAVIAAYVGSLLGRGPRDHTPRERALYLLFSVASLPAQFLPMAIAAAGKGAEARQVRRANRDLRAWLESRAVDQAAREVEA